MMTNTTALAAALNECMPLTIDETTYTTAEAPDSLPPRVRLVADDGDCIGVSEIEIIGILSRECQRLQWWIEQQSDRVEIWNPVKDTYHDWDGTDALAFAIAFAAAKKADEQR
jgi:hypothetical protein